MTTKAIPLPGEVRGTGRKRARGTFPAARPLRTGRPRFQRLRVIAALVLRGMGARNSRATGGYLWAILQPLGSTLLIALAFSMMLRSPPLGTSFILFYATGTIPFRHYGAMSGAIAGAIASNRGLLAYPVVNPLDAVFAAAILAFVTDAMVAIGIFAGIAAFTDADIVLDLAPVAGAFFLAALLGLGVGTVNCVLFGFFPTWKNVWSVLSRPLFLMSGILYLYDSGADRAAGDPVVEPDAAGRRADALGLLRQLRGDLCLGTLHPRGRGYAVPGRRLADPPARGLPDRAVSGRRPGVSVITPVWNAEATLAETVASVQAQTRGDWEMLLVDDGSQRRQPRARRAAGRRRAAASGFSAGAATAARRRRATPASARAAGRFLAFLDADDLWEPEKLAVQIGYMERDGGAVQLRRLPAHRRGRPDARPRRGAGAGRPRAAAHAATSSPA